MVKRSVKAGDLTEAGSVQQPLVEQDSEVGEEYPTPAPHHAR